MMSKKKDPAPVGGSSTSSDRLFAAVSKLDSDDARASRARRAAAVSSVARSRAARSQADIGAGLVECRILLQRAVQAPGAAADGGGARKRRKRNDNETGGKRGGDGAREIAAADRLLAKLLEARNRLCLPFDTGGEDPDYVALVSRDRRGDRNDGNSGDEVPKPQTLERTLQEEYDVCRSMWKETLNRRHHDLRLHAGLTAKTKFRAVDRSFWEQLEAAVAHEKLMRIAHEDNKDEGKEDDEGDKRGEDSNEWPSPLVFDDSRAYQLLLRDFVSLGAVAGLGRAGGGGTVTDAATERLRRAAKKKKGSSKDVDRKASKGRKIRYAVNPKLKNFTFPISRPVPAISDDDWFKSLFGGAVRAK